MQNSSIWTRKNMLISKNITNEEVVEKTAKEIVHDIKLYIMLFLNRYTDMNHVIEDEENRGYPYNKFFVKDRTLLVMYYIQRGAKYALSYAEHYTYHVKGMELQMYEELYEKLKEYTKQT